MEELQARKQAWQEQECGYDIYSLHYDLEKL